MSEMPNLDLAAIQRLQRLGDATFVCRMIDLFLEYTESKISEARAAQGAGDFLRVQRAAHPIKSSAGNIGAWRIQELAAKLEDCARAEQPEPLAASLSELEQAFAAVKPELQQQRQTLSPKPA